MSTYYDFYLGYKKDGVFHAIGPYGRNEKGEYYLTNIFSRSSSYVTELKNYFSSTETLEEMDDDVKELAKYVGWFSDGYSYRLYFMPLSELRAYAGNEGIRSGYVSVDAVNIYESIPKEDRDMEFCDYDFEFVSSIVYAKMDKEEQRNFIYYSWIDYNSKSYVASRICSIVDEFQHCNSYADFDSYDDSNIYIYMKIS